MAPSRRIRQVKSAKSSKSVSNPNPFQERWNRSKATTIRRYARAAQTRNSIVDKRIAEHDPNVSEADRYLLRLQRERAKTNKRAARYNLNDKDDYDDDPSNRPSDSKGSLTPFPAAAASVTQKNSSDHRGAPDDDDDGEALFTIKRPESNPPINEPTDDVDDDEHLLPESDSDSDNNDMPRTKREVMHELIQKSKAHKAQRQQEKHQVDEQTARLDTGLPQIMELLQEAQADKSKYLDETNVPLVVSTNVSVQSAPQNSEQSEFKYESVYQMLASEKRARPSERLLTAEEVAEKERDRLHELEEMRQRRMKEMDDYEKGLNHEKRAVREHAGADDLVDSFNIGEDSFPRTDENSFDNENENDNDDKNLPKALNETPDEQPVGTASEFWKAFTVKEVVARSSQTRDVPFVYTECPKNAADIQSLFSDATVEQRGLVVERLYKCFALSLDVRRNRHRLQRLLQCLLFWIERLCEVDNEHLDISFQEINVLTHHVHSLGSDFQNTLGPWGLKCVADCARPLGENEGFSPISACWSVKHVLILRAVSYLFPSSDLRHSVMTPLAMVLSEALNASRIQTIVDVAIGVFIAYVLMETIGGRNGFSPELARFIGKVVCSCYSTKYSHDISEEKLHQAFAGQEINEATCTLSLSEVDALIRDEQPRSDITCSLISAILSVAEVMCDSWTPHADILFAYVSVDQIAATSVRNRFANILKVKDGERRPLTLYEKRERAIVKVLNPRMHSEANGVYHKRGRSRLGASNSLEEAATAAKRVRRALKRAVRGQARDIRRDAKEVAHERLKEEDMRREKADAKDKEVRAFLEHQRSTWRAAEKAQKKLSGKRW